MKKYFFNKTLAFFKDYKIQDKKIILGVSGGLDSIVLLDLLKELSAPCRLQLYIAHIHHGPSSTQSLKKHRDKAKKFVKRLSLSYGLDFLCPPQSKKKLKSEEDFRGFRHSRLKKILTQKKGDLIALAHNKNDLLETRLIHLIRGCGEKGLKSLSARNPPYLRPLLFWTRREIQAYAEQKKLKWLDDPSNKDNHYLRNWIRNRWLIDLESKRSGSIKSLARSLEALSPFEEKPEGQSSCFLSSKGIKRKRLIELPLKEQKRVLAFYMRKIGLSHYGQSHIEEILKQAERAEKEFSAQILKKTWVFTLDRIFAK